MKKIFIFICIAILPSSVIPQNSFFSEGYPDHYLEMGEDDWDSIKVDLENIKKFKNTETFLQSDQFLDIWYKILRVRDIRWEKKEREVITYLESFSNDIFLNNSFITKDAVYEVFEGKYRDRRIGLNPIYIPLLTFESLYILDETKKSCCRLIESYWRKLPDRQGSLAEYRKYFLKMIAGKLYKSECIVENINKLSNENYDSLSKEEKKLIERLRQKYYTSRISKQKDAWQYLWEQSLPQLTSKPATWNNRRIWSNNINLLFEVFGNVNIDVLIKIYESSTSIEKKYIFLYNVICVARVKKKKKQNLTKAELQKIQTLIENFYLINSPLVKQKEFGSSDFVKSVYKLFQKELIQQN